MGSNKNDLTSQYTTLQNAVNQSSLHANRQLKLINGNTYIAGFILLFLALGITYFLDIFAYWIPSVFLLFYVIFFTSLLSTKLPYMHRDVKDFFSEYTKKKTRIERRTDSCIKKNLAIVAQSLSIIFVISFFMLLSVEYNWIAINQSIEIFIPALTCLLFLPVPLFIEEFHEIIHPFKIKSSLQKIVNRNKKSPWKALMNLDFLKPLFLGLYLILLLLLPLISFGLTYTVITEWPYLLLVFLFQLFLFFLFASSFSANTVQKELASSINSYADIDYLLSLAHVHKDYSGTEYDRLESLYQVAKPYDFSVLNVFKFINYYMLIPNRINLNKSLSHPLKNFSENRPKAAGSIEKKTSNIKSPKKEIPTIQRKTQSPTPAFTSPSNNVSSRAEAKKVPTNKVTSEKKIEKKNEKKPQEKPKIKPKNDKRGKVGILLYGPMLDRVSDEIEAAVKKRIKKIRTPFNVELARKNESYGGAPGLVPVSSGGTKVNAELLVFKEDVSERQVMNMLYRMEHQLQGTNKTYKKPSHPTPNDFVIKTLQDFYKVDKVFYPSIGRNINQISPKKLAKLIIESVYNTDEKEPDGITYLIDLKKYDITTPMSDACEEEILRQTYSGTLSESRQKIDKVNAIKLNAN